MHDLVIRNGTIVDGTGAPRRSGDLAIDGGLITAIDEKAGCGKREIDAEGHLVTPGWVDIHTHYDGQVTWDPYLTPSSWNGVTTVVMGNCGVGFAPAKPDQHRWLISLMESVEDIPGASIAEGMRWQWESFPEYMDAIERIDLALDVATQIPHCALRVYVMGERGLGTEDPTAEENEQMGQLVLEAVEAGAMGVSTSRTILHRTKEGSPVPGTFAGEAELMALGRALGKAGRGLFEMVSDIGLGGMHGQFKDDLRLMSKISKENGRPVHYILSQDHAHPDEWREMLAATQRAVDEGAQIMAQVPARPTGLLLGLECTLHPFLKHPTYVEFRRLPLAERVRRMRDPQVRARILGEQTGFKDAFRRDIAVDFTRMFRLGDPPDYEPAAQESIAAMAERKGMHPAALAYDILLERDGKEILYRPLSNYKDYDFEVTRELLRHPLTVSSLSDGGAHCGVICDASNPTFLLTHWVRDRTRGEKLALEEAVRMQTGDTARTYGLHDRGILAPGMKADVNVIDLDALALSRPEIVYDLPAGGRRIIQKVRGYKATVVSGQITFEDGTATGVLPGRLVRGSASTAA